VRIVFMGSPSFALPSLQRLIASDHDVAAVVTQPDRRAGRGRGLRPPPVKELAVDQGLTVLQPEKASAPESVDAIASVEPDALVIAAYGQILKQSLLDVPKRGALNVHASLLPRHRGASPVSAAILAGDAETGVTIMEVVLALDAGPMVARRAAPIYANDSAGTLTEKLAEMGADLLVEVLPRWERGEVTAETQDDTQATYAPPLHREDAIIDWNRSAVEIWRRVRAYNPWPMATTSLNGETFRVLEATPLDVRADAPPGTVVPVPPGVGMPPKAAFAVACGYGALGLQRAQRAGRRAMTGDELLRGSRDLIGSRLGG
jgi:methionyl-tRNA formyltransferase